MLDRDREFGELQTANDFLRAYAADRETGHARSLEDYQAEFPGHAELIAAELARLGAAAAAAPRCGPYLLEQELGRGAFGSVSLATDTRTGRRVALKVVAIHGRDHHALIERLRREADAMARLDDPCVCPIYDVGGARGLGWIAMRYIRGESLGERIRRAVESDGAVGVAPAEVSARRDAAERDWILERFEAAARGLHRVHEAGFVHRDIKPSNMMIDADGRPVLLDFGLVRDIATDRLDLTTSGDVLGTPAYMAPELVRGRAGTADARTDVYALAASLYEALTLRRPFESPSRESLYRAIVDDPVPDPRKHRRDVSRDLSVVLRTALEKSPTRRYASALAFAEDLHRVLTRQPILARRAGSLVVLVRLAMRHKVLATGLVLLITFLAALAIQQHLANRAIAAERDEAKASLHRATAYFLAGLAARTIDQWPERATWFAYRSLEMLDSQIGRSMLYEAFQRQHALRAMRGQGASIRGIEASRDGRTLLSFADCRDACVWDTASGRLQQRLAQHDAAIAAIALSTDGERAATADEVGSVRVWDTRSGTSLCELRARGTITSLALSADGAILAYGTGDGACTLLATATGERLQAPAGAAAPVALRFAPAGERLASLDAEGDLRVLDARTAKPLAHTRLTGSTAPRAGEWARVGWSIDGRVLAYVPGGPLVVFDPAATTEAVIQLAAATVCEPDWDPTGAFAAVCYRDASSRRVALIDVVRRERLELVDLPSFSRIAIAPDGRRIVAWDGGTWVAHWLDVGTGARGELLGHAGELTTLGFLADGTVVSGGRDGTVRSWTLEAPSRWTVGAMPRGARGLALSSDGERSLVFAEGRALVADTRSGDVRCALRTDDAVQLSFLGSRRVLGVAADQLVVFAADGTVERRLPRPPGAVQLGRDPRDRWLAVWSPRGPLRLFDLERPATVPALTIGTEADTFRGAWADPTGARLTTADGERGSVRVWDIATGVAHTEISSPGIVSGACSDGDRLVPLFADAAMRTLPPAVEADPASTGADALAFEYALRAAAAADLVAKFDNEIVALSRISTGELIATIAVPSIADVAIRADEIVVIDIDARLHAFPIDIAAHVRRDLLIEPRPILLVDNDVVAPSSAALTERVIAWIDTWHDAAGALECVPMLAREARGPVLERAVADQPRSFVARACLAIHYGLESLREDLPAAARRALADAADRTVREALPLLDASCEPLPALARWRTWLKALEGRDEFAPLVAAFRAR